MNRRCDILIVTFLSYLITLGYSVDVLIVRVLSHLLTSIDLTLTKELHSYAFVERPSYCYISIPIDSNCYICYFPMAFQDSEIMISYLSSYYSDVQ